MRNTFRNPALQRLHDVGDGQGKHPWRAMNFTRGQAWSRPDAAVPELWFLESGVLVLEQTFNNCLVEVALIGCSLGVLLPEHSEGRVRALLDGQGFALPVAHVASLCPEVLLQTQQSLVRQMAVWTYCTRLHALPQVLADRMLWMEPASLTWSMDTLPWGGQGKSAAVERAVQELQRAGAVRVEGGVVQVVSVDVLRRMACGCHTSLAETASATLMPSTPADRMPPA